MKYIFSIAFSLGGILNSLAAVIPEHLIQHADSADKAITISHKNLSKYLASGASTEEEKVFIFSYWIAKNIRYNLREAKKQHRTNKTACEVLRNKNAVCEGFSILFQQFCQNEGITSYVVYGHGYGNPIRRATTFSHLRHAWNVVYADGKWMALDVTWASSEMKHTDFKNTRTLSWIDTEPAKFSESHYPNDPRWQMLKNPRSAKEFWSREKNISEKNYAIADSLNILLTRERYRNELIICNSEYAEQGDAHIYLKNLIHLGWKYVGGAFEPKRVEQGIEIFSFAQKELQRIDPLLTNLLYEPNIEKGLSTAQTRLEKKD